MGATSRPAGVVRPETCGKLQAKPRERKSLPRSGFVQALLSRPSIFDKAGIMGKRSFATVPFSHNTTRSDFIEGFGLLTAGGVRHITSPLSWRPASAGNRQRAKLPETRQYGLINGKAPS
jgi:hypothetical protein